ncbi:membrane bound O-acyl transferase family-domain-containing protein [Thelephora terrestris]|uniref:Membrane bound O-acyl transferase family-domain-containing protein n=1 Tax=Thelephora terrestris TaxID=56493 RepID=A0A9P6H6X8_9AGAM|nr:membrane bound O-acyl transferase family-domain-containing protein [Thelephora terrestris]
MMGRYPLAEILLFEVLHILVFFPTRHNLYRVIIIALMIYLAAKIYLTMEATEPAGLAYTVGHTIALNLGFTAYLLWTEGSFLNHWRRVRDEVGAGADADGSNDLPSNFPLTKKLWWMLDITHSVRMVGWVQEPKDSLPPPPPPSRGTFLWKTSLKFIVNIVFLDLFTLIFAQNPVFDPHVHEPTDGPETYLAAIPLLHRAPYALAFGFWVALWFKIPHNLGALVCVGLGRSSPTLWPDVWGRWGDAYTLRKLWGRTWHQTMRPMLSGFGRLVANKFLKFPRGTNLSSYTQLYVAFLMSAVFHFAGEFMYERRVVYRSLKFFPLQAVAITLEDFIIFIAKRSLLKRGIKLNPGNSDESWAEAVVRVVGYCWVTLWFCLTLPGYIDGASLAGNYITDRWFIAQFLFDKWKLWV